MEGLTTPVSWYEIALRLVVTAAAALALGVNRTEHGKAAGMRTTVLAGIAAAVSMILVNLLLPTAGRQSDSFVTIDAMRLPLGILTGVGFIGGGTILKHGSIVTGVTTAATLWLTTVVGLCFGSGQHILGFAATGFGLAALWPLATIEGLLPRETVASLTVEIADSSLTLHTLREKIGDAGFTIIACSVALEPMKKRSRFVFHLRYIKSTAASPNNLVEAMATEIGVNRVMWQDSHMTDALSEHA